ncbi:hypothetical protein OIN60_22135 [Paenibacillus sp. P96]|uniref:Uncharacterized protein n=1 Tax=Paenibacillus zeirhizosphaerae TaxID=2987519 RepID=A0ABT9FXG2_9BACL|nr:hypothetical protein [Paenibacillus sp. P96]MDP4099419.1 hypothetical protein [Paenibacillus sp. P96]
MELFDKADRLGIKWISNTEGHDTLLHIEDLSYCIVRAPLIWYSEQPASTIDIVTESNTLTLEAESEFQESSTGRYLHIKDITFFVQVNSRAEYAVIPKSGASDTLVWHLPIIYNCPFLPPCHLSLHVQSEPAAPLWETWLDQLPEITTDISLPAELHVLEGNTHRTYMDSFSMEKGLKNQPFYPKVREDSPHPYLITQRVLGRDAVMNLAQSADHSVIKLGDIVTCRTVITNTGTTTCMYVQYRTTLLSCARLVPGSFVINGIEVPMATDSMNVITVILRNMPVGDLLDVSFRMEIHEKAEVEKLYMSSVLDYHFQPVDDRLLIGNQPSNVVEFIWGEAEGEGEAGDEAETEETSG